MTEKRVRSTDDLLLLLDGVLQDRGGEWWDAFFADFTKPVPFFVEWPDENLVTYHIHEVHCQRHG